MLDTNRFGLGHLMLRVRWMVVLTLVVLGCGGSSPTDAGPPPPTADLAVLFIGNSLTFFNGMPEILEGLFDLGNAGSVFIGAEVAPNVGLQDHWAAGGARDRIAQGGWDVVVLQQGPSATEGCPSLLEFSQLFAEEIRANGGEPALYMVWPAEARFFDFPGVSDAYSTAADLVDGILFPVGEAWLEAWERDEDIPLYASDRFHPSLMGSYLAALVMYQQLTGLDPRDLPALIPTPSGGVAMSEGRALILQEAAFAANALHARP